MSIEHYSIEAVHLLLDTFGAVFSTLRYKVGYWECGREKRRTKEHAGMKLIFLAAISDRKYKITKNEVECIFNLI